MIYFDRVTKTYPDETVALRGIDLKIEPNEFISIVGHSGAGKTTLMKMVLAEEFPSDGRVLFGSTDIHALREKDINQLRRRIGTIFQDFRLLMNKNVYENVAFAMEATGATDEEIASDVPYALDLVGLKDKVWNFPHELSGGEKQRVAIARALVNRPDVIIADEPTGNLDPLNTHEIVQLLQKVNELGTTIILTTHNKGVIDGLGKRVVTMENGKIIRDDSSGRYVI
jgi:cell division transport system ATP-binding protein